MQRQNHLFFVELPVAVDVEDAEPEAARGGRALVLLREEEPREVVVVHAAALGGDAEEDSSLPSAAFTTGMMSKAIGAIERKSSTNQPLR